MDGRIKKQAKRTSSRRFQHGSTENPTADMTVKRFIAAAFAFGLGLPLGSCSSVSDFVSDSWPHFAGGEPAGVPPRPGTPGYAAFIAHGQPTGTVNPPAGNGQDAATGPTASVAERTPPGDEQHVATGVSSATKSPAGAGQAPTTVAAPPGAADRNVQSGLY